MLVCVVTLEMEEAAPLHACQPRRVSWCGSPDERDWERLEGFKKRDGWRTVSHRREFVDARDTEQVADSVEFAA